MSAIRCCYLCSRIIVKTSTPFRYELFCESINIICQICDANNCICFEENIFIKKESLDKWQSDDYIVNECLIRLGLKKYSTSEQGDKKIKK